MKGMHHPNMSAEKLCTIQEFPSKRIQSNPARFKANLRDLTDQSSLPRDKIEAWKKRQKDAKYQKELKEKAKKAKEKEEREKKEKEEQRKRDKEKVQNVEDTKEESKATAKD